MMRVTKLFSVVARDCPLEQLSEYLDREPRVELGRRRAVGVFDGEKFVLKLYGAPPVESIRVGGAEQRSRYCGGGSIFIFSLEPAQRHALDVEGERFHLELDVEAPEVLDNPIARAKAALHRQRDTGPVGVRSEAQERLLAESEVGALLREGQVKNDEPELLVALLRFHASEVRARKRLLLQFFDSWALEDLRLLLRVTTGEARGAGEELSPQERAHTFCRRATAWHGIAHSQGAALWVDGIRAVISSKEAGDTGLEQEEKWWLVVQEYTERGKAETV